MRLPKMQKYHGSSNLLFRCQDPFVVPIPDDHGMFPSACLSYVHTAVGKSSPQVVTTWSEDAAIASNLRPFCYGSDYSEMCVGESPGVGASSRDAHRDASAAGMTGIGRTRIAKPHASFLHCTSYSPGIAGFRYGSNPQRNDM